MMKLRKISLIILSLTILFIGARQASACTCYGRLNNENFQPCGSYWMADAVFVGLAENVSIENGRMKVSFTVEKSIRGASDKTIEIFTSASSGSCGYPFKEGERYFVYSRRGQDGKLEESLCGPTVLLRSAAADLEYQKEIEAGKSGTRLFGSVRQFKKESYKDQDSFIPLADIEINVKGKKSEFKTKTDENGLYVFKDIPPDVYRVMAKLPDGLREIFIREDLINHYAVIYEKDAPRCDSENFIATSQGSIRGKIIGSDGQNPLQQYVSLLPIDENGKAFFAFSPSRAVWANRENGEFFFNTVPAGKYLISINPKNCPTPNRNSSEYGQMFFPGVGNESEAKIITVKEYQQLKIEDFRLLPPLEERWFSGTVLSADKTPVANATVFMTVGNSKECFTTERLANVKTDEFGRFRFKGYKSYSYQIRAYTETKTSQGQTVPRLLSKIFEIPLTGEVKDIELIVDSTY